MISPAQPASPSIEGAFPARSWRREGWPMLWSAMAAAAVPAAVYLLAKALHLPGGHAVTVCLAAAVVWVALACPVLAAGPDRSFAAILRAACAIDGVVVALLLLWLAEPTATAAGLAKAYCTLVALGLAGAAAARCARTSAGRYAAAVVAAAALAVILAGPFLVGGLIKAVGPEAARPAFSWLHHANPFVSVTMALRPQTNIVWPTTAWLYWVSDSGAYPAPAPTPWYAAALIYLAAAAALTGVAALVRPRPLRTL